MKKTILIPALTLGLLVASPKCAAAQEFSCEKIISGRLENALKFYQKAEPTTENLYCLANAYRLIKEPDKAIETFARITAESMENGEQEQILASLASIYFDKGDYKKMKESYEALLKLNPKSHFRDLALERMKDVNI